MTSGSMYIGAIVVILLLKYRNALYRFVRTRWIVSKLPVLKRTTFPVIGHSHLFTGGPIEGFRKENVLRFETIDKYNEKMAVIWLGPLPYIWVLHPDVCEIILRSSKHTEKSFIYEFLQCWLGTGLLTSKGEKWSQRRKLITPSFHFTILEDFFETINEQARTLGHKLRGLKRNNGEVNLVKCVTMCALDIICETAMGKSVNAQTQEDSEYVKAVSGVAELVQNRVNAPWLWSDFVFYRTERGKRQTKLLGILHGFTQSVIRDRMAEVKSSKENGSTRRLAFLDLLLRAETEDGEKLPLSGIQEEVDTFMFEGHDTTSAAMTWALYLLGRHPEVQRRAQKEIDDVVGDSDVINFTMEDLRKLEYLERVIKESLRLYPSVYIFARVMSEDCKVEGFTIPKGTDVGIYPYVIHRHPQFWENPDKFDPERFTKANSLNRHPYAYIPFSAGPRNCIGQKFALMEEKVILAQILRHYDVASSTELKDLELVGDLVLRSNDTLDLTITERN